MEVLWVEDAPAFAATQHNGAAPQRKDDLVVQGVGARWSLLCVYRTSGGFVCQFRLCHLPISGVHCIASPSVFAGGAAGIPKAFISKKRATESFERFESNILAGKYILLVNKTKISTLNLILNFT